MFRKIAVVAVSSGCLAGAFAFAEPAAAGCTGNAPLPDLRGRVAGSQYIGKGVKGCNNAEWNLQRSPGQSVKIEFRARNDTLFKESIKLFEFSSLDMAPNFKITYSYKGKDVTEKFSENPGQGRVFKNIEQDALTPVVTVKVKVRNNADLAGETSVHLGANFVGDSQPNTNADVISLYLDVRD